MLTITDEQAIRDLVSGWMAASQAGDTARVLDLMTDDVVFLVPGQEPFGKAEFAAASSKAQGVKIEATAEIQEIEVSGDLAFARNKLEVTVTPPNGTPIRRSGPTLTMFRKGRDGKWRLARDANLLTVRV